VALVRKLGADAAVDGHHGDIAAAARSFAPDGIHAVLGLAGGDGLEQCLDALRSGGRVAYPNGIEPAPGERHGIHIVPYDAVAGGREFTALGLAVEAAKLQVPIAGHFPLGDAARAHQRLAKGTCRARSCCVPMNRKMAEMATRGEASGRG
jgi:NADPH2:quinone reductase